MCVYTYIHTRINVSVYVYMYQVYIYLRFEHINIWHMKFDCNIYTCICVYAHIYVTYMIWIRCLCIYIHHACMWHILVSIAPRYFTRSLTTIQYCFCDIYVTSINISIFHTHYCMTYEVRVSCMGAARHSARSLASKHLCFGVICHTYRYTYISHTSLYDIWSSRVIYGSCSTLHTITRRGGGLGSSTIFKKFNEPHAPS